LEEKFVAKPAQIKARPFLKWAGGKRQLLPQIDRFLPKELNEGSITRYVEPFVGSGAVFFHVAQKYLPAQLYISDYNPELMRAYRTIQQCVDDLIPTLRDIEYEYLSLTDEARKNYFYEQRTQFNKELARTKRESVSLENVERTAQLIFLNRTCYNGLFRVNSKGAFNVPFGRYRNPRICDAANLRAVAALLQQTEIRYGSYKDCAAVVDENTMVYFDPPYRPISKTANFTAYSKQVFDDKAQTDLARFYRSLDQRGARLMLSNSDPKNVDLDDSFFEDTYAGFRIERVHASRRINSQAEKRGPIHELLILNY
jgi:DNA adenine methylase